MAGRKIGRILPWTNIGQLSGLECISMPYCRFVCLCGNYHYNSESIWLIGKFTGIQCKWFLWILFGQKLMDLMEIVSAGQPIGNDQVPPPLQLDIDPPQVSHLYSYSFKLYFLFSSAFIALLIQQLCWSVSLQSIPYHCYFFLIKKWVDESFHSADYMFLLNLWLSLHLSLNCLDCWLQYFDQVYDLC